MIADSRTNHTKVFVCSVNNKSNIIHKCYVILDFFSAGTAAAHFIFFGGRSHTFLDAFVLLFFSQLHLVSV